MLKTNDTFYIAGLNNLLNSLQASVHIFTLPFLQGAQSSILDNFVPPGQE